MRERGEKTEKARVYGYLLHRMLLFIGFEASLARIVGLVGVIFALVFYFLLPLTSAAPRLLCVCGLVSIALGEAVRWGVKRVRARLERAPREL